MAIENAEDDIYALQYHPEVRHSVRGNEVLRRFLFHIARISPDWKIENILEEELQKLQQAVSPVRQDARNCADPDCCLCFLRLCTLGFEQTGLSISQLLNKLNFTGATQKAKA